MSLAYFIVLNHEEPGFDPFVSGKFLAHAADDVNKIAEQNGLKLIDDWVSQDLGDYSDEFEGIGDTEPRWFSPQEGVEWVNALKGQLNEHADAVENLDGVLSDLEEFREVLQKAQSKQIQWHLEMDF